MAHSSRRLVNMLLMPFLLIGFGGLPVYGQTIQRTTLTQQMKQQVRRCNETSRKAAAYILDQSVLGGNIRSQQATYVSDLHPTMYTADSVQIYSNNRVLLGYSPRFNAFLPVRTKEGALRLATDRFEPRNTASGRGIHRRKPDPNGYRAEILLDIEEDYSMLPRKETEEEVLK